MPLTLPCRFNLEKVSESPTVGTVARVAMGGLNRNGLILGSEWPPGLLWKKKPAFRVAAIDLIQPLWIWDVEAFTF